MERHTPKPDGRVFIPLLAGALTAWAGFARAQPGEAPSIGLTLFADQSAVVPGQTFMLGVLVDVQKGWHIYWLNPGDSGQATDITFTAPPGYTVGDLRWPIPQRYELPPDLVTFGYEGKVLFTVPVTVPEDAVLGDEASFEVSAEWLACKELCIPGDGTASLTLPIASAASPANTEVFQGVSLPITPAEAQDRVVVSVTGGLERASREGAYKITAQWANDPPREILFFPGGDDAILLGRPEVSTADDGATTIRQPAKLLQGLEPSTDTLPMLIRWTEQDGSTHAVEIPASVYDKTVVPN